uniref:Uncharacterized protein n=1 Tax=Arundo donax TaxID=35708 RepID=A0A0A9C815_ARUDO
MHARRWCLSEKDDDSLASANQENARADEGFDTAVSYASR